MKTITKQDLQTTLNVLNELKYMPFSQKNISVGIKRQDCFDEAASLVQYSLMKSDDNATELDKLELLKTIYNAILFKL